MGDKFKGIFDDGNFPTLYENQGLIVNKPTNQHWIAIANIDGHLHTYDSFGRHTINGDPLEHTIDIPISIKQKKDQTNCGARSLTALYMLLNS